MLPTTIQPFTLLSDQDGLPLSGLLLLPQEETVPCGILQVSHGMCEHKERYLDFLRHCIKRNMQGCRSICWGTAWARSLLAAICGSIRTFWTV